MYSKSNLNYPAFPTDTYKLYDYVYVISDHSYYKYGGVARISTIPDHCSGYEVQDTELQEFHIQEEDIVRFATQVEINQYNKSVDFEIELRYIDDSM